MNEKFQEAGDFLVGLVSAGLCGAVLLWGTVSSNQTSISNIRTDVDVIRGDLEYVRDRVDYLIERELDNE